MWVSIWYVIGAKVSRCGEGVKRRWERVEKGKLERAEKGKRGPIVVGVPEPVFPPAAPDGGVAGAR